MVPVIAAYLDRGGIQVCLQSPDGRERVKAGALKPWIRYCLHPEGKLDDRGQPRLLESEPQAAAVVSGWERPFDQGRLGAIDLTLGVRQMDGGKFELISEGALRVDLAGKSELQIWEEVEGFYEQNRDALLHHANSAGSALYFTRGLDGELTLAAPPNVYLFPAQGELSPAPIRPTVSVFDGGHTLRHPTCTWHQLMEALAGAADANDDQEIEVGNSRFAALYLRRLQLGISHRTGGPSRLIEVEGKSAQELFAQTKGWFLENRAEIEEAAKQESRQRIDRAPVEKSEPADLVDLGEDGVGIKTVPPERVVTPVSQTNGLSFALLVGSGLVIAAGFGYYKFKPS